MRLGDIEAKTPLMQSFWLMSPFRSRDDAGKQYWTEFNHEWNNWFCSHGFGHPLAYPRTFCGDASDTTFAYIANGIQRDGDGAESITKGGFPMRNPNRVDAPPFSCLLRSPVGNSTVAIDNADECMAFFVGTHEESPWVDWLIQIDKGDMKFSAIARLASGASVVMSSTLNMTALQGYIWEPQPMVTFIGQLVRWYPIAALSQPQGFDVDWFLYTQRTDLSLDEIAKLADELEPLSRVIEAADEKPRLARPDHSPLSISLRPPLQLRAPYAFSIRPTVRETNAYRVKWTYRTSSIFGASSWSNIAEGGFTLVINSHFPASAIDVAIEIDDEESPEEKSVRLCTRFNISSATFIELPCPSQLD